jgi:hypothetical protein
MHAASLLVAGTDPLANGDFTVGDVLPGDIPQEIEQLSPFQVSVQLTSLVLPAGASSTQTLEVQKRDLQKVR